MTARLLLACANLLLAALQPRHGPIEIAFSKLMSLLRQESARTVNGLVERIGGLLYPFVANEVRSNEDVLFLQADPQRSIKF